MRLLSILLCGVLCTVSYGEQSKPRETNITVDVSRNRHPISPLIYGVNFGTTKQLQLLRAPVNRLGGAAAEVYDYHSGARNAGNNWFYESYPANKADILAQYGEDFISLTQRAGADSLITIPMMGWVAKLGPNRTRLSSYSIAKYGLQKSTDAHGMTEAGNGIRLDGGVIHNDPNDAMQPDTPGREAVWVRSLLKNRRSGETRYYLLGNEPSLWHENRRACIPKACMHRSYLRRHWLLRRRFITLILLQRSWAQRNGRPSERSAVASIFSFNPPKEVPSPIVFAKLAAWTCFLGCFANGKPQAILWI